MGFKRTKGAGRTAVIAVAAVVGMVGLPIPMGTANAAGTGSKFQNGTWNLFFSATLKCQPQQGQLGLAGVVASRQPQLADGNTAQET